MRESIVEIAKTLRDAEIESVPCAPPSENYELNDEIAYGVQKHNIDIKIKDGRRIIGRKVGLTSEAIQSWLGVDRPDFGTLMDDMLVDNGASFSATRLLQPRAEAEIAFVMGEDLKGPTVVNDVIRATDYVLPAIEIIDSRIADWKITFFDTVADNASSGLFVLGDKPTRLIDINLSLAGMWLKKNGKVVSTGAGAACLGSPLKAIAWLANTLNALDTPIQKGDIILSGALGPVTPLVAGDYVQCSISKLGDASFRVV